MPNSDLAYGATREHDKVQRKKFYKRDLESRWRTSLTKQSQEFDDDIEFWRPGGIGEQSAGDSFSASAKQGPLP